MNPIIESFTLTVAIMKQNLPLVLWLIGGLWVVHIFNWLCGYRFNVFGIHPRRGVGLPGILLSPLLHGHFDHLFFNSIPLFVLANFMFINGVKTFWVATLTIVVISGMAIWCLGRNAIHIGASSVIMGFLGFLLMNVYTQGTIVAVGIGAVCIYYFAGMLLDLFPSDVKVSWEGHLFGFLAGLIAAFATPVLLSYVS